MLQWCAACSLHTAAAQVAYLNRTTSRQSGHVHVSLIEGCILFGEQEERICRLALFFFLTNLAGANWPTCGETGVAKPLANTEAPASPRLGCTPMIIITGAGAAKASAVIFWGLCLSA